MGESEEGQDKDEMDGEEKAEQGEEDAESGDDEDEDEDEDDEDEEDGKPKKKKVVKAAAPVQAEIRDVAKQIPGKFAAKTRVKYLKIAYKLYKADYKKSRKVKVSKKKQKNKYRIKGYRIKYYAKIARKCKEELKIAKAVFKAEGALESRRKALDGAINSGKEKSIWKAKKNMLNYRGKLRSTHKDWFNDWRGKIKEWKKEYQATKRQIRRAKKLISKHKRKLKP